MGNGVMWVTETGIPHSAPNDAFLPDQSGISDKVLDSPDIAISSASATVTFANFFETEAGDGGVLEVSSPNINGGTFTDITDPAVGGEFVAGGYTATLGTSGNPLAGRMVWGGNSGGYITTVANLGPNVNGQTIKLRFRMGTDATGGAPGWWVDDIVITGGPCASPTPGGGTPTPTPSGSATPGTNHSLNLSTRLNVGTGNDVGIGGFIVTGTGPRHVLLRGLGPSLTSVTNPLADPVLALHGPAGFTTITDNDWMDDPTQKALIIATGLPPTNMLESAIVADLDPGAYTAILSGNGGLTGIGLVEIYDLSPTQDSKLANISTRAAVGTGNNIVIAGFILGGGSDMDPIIVRGLGPSITSVTGTLADPFLELRDSSGTLVRSDDNWMDDPTQKALIIAAGLAPTNNSESAIAETLMPGAYTALLSGVGGTTGIGLVEVYDHPASAPTATPCPACTPTPTAPPGTPTPPGGTLTPPPSTPTPTPGNSTCTENFDGVTAPALPAGWAASNPTAGDGVMFATTTTNADSAPNAAFTEDQDGISDKVLDRMNVTIQSATATMTFRNNFNSEMSGGVFWDGGVLEVSAPNINSGDFTDITDSHVGGMITAGGYTGEISGDAMNPLAGRMAWSGNSGGYIDTAISLGPNLVGQTVTFRWRFGTDEATSAPGWWIDGIVITGASCP
jgi:hypothetical protein